MKRLIPFDSFRSRRSDHPRKQFRRTHESSVNHGNGDPFARSCAARHCALPVEPNPRRIAFYAVVSKSVDADEGILHVQETQIAIVPFRDTALMHFAPSSSGSAGQDLLISITENTCIDVARPYVLPDAGCPIIVIGIDLGVTVEAEIIAGMESEARYRPLILRHQSSREWYRTDSNESQSGGA